MSSKDLIEHQAQNKSSTITKLKEAMREIEKEVRTLGYYSRNNGRVTVKETCNRAGVGYSTLKNDTHKETRLKVRAWLKRLKPGSPNASPDADVIKSGRSSSLIKQIEMIASKFQRFKIEYDKISERLALVEEDNIRLLVEKGAQKEREEALLQRIAELELELARVMQSNVIPFPRP